MNKLKLVLTFMILSHVGFTQNLFTKAITKLAKVMAPAPVMVSSLDNITPTVGIASNLHPTEVGSIDQTFYNGWKTGGDLTYLMFTQKKGGMVKIDGTVTIDGMPVEYNSPGIYSVVSDPNPSPRKVEITTSTGQKSSFTLEPSKKQVKIVSINGQKDNISLDLTKDVVIELEGKQLTDNTKLKVSLAINQVSIKSLYGVCYIKNSPKITVPAAAFRNINIKPGGSAIYSYKKSFLSVGIEEAQTASNGNLPAVAYTTNYDDGKMVTISKEPDLNLGLVVKGKEDLKDGAMNYDFYKPNAFTSRPSNTLKKIGLLSCSIQGKTFVENSVITQEKNNAKGESQTTKTTTISFPKQTNEVWDAVLAKIYPQLNAILQSEMNATVLPLDAVTKTTAYKGIESLAKEDVNTNVEFSKAFGKTKTLASSMPISEGVGANSVTDRMINEAGADALMTISLELVAEQDGDFGVMIPKLTVELVGKANGPQAGTTYYTATVTGKGVPSEHIGLKVAFFSANGLELKGRNDSKVYHSMSDISADELDKIVRRSDLLVAFTKGLKEIKEKEKQTQIMKLSGTCNRRV